MSYYVIFGLLGAGTGGVLFALLYSGTSWNPYLAWLVAWSATAFAMYGLDKTLARANGPRVPELVLHSLAAIGGFAGGWLGMAAFHHKSNYRRHPGIWAVLVLSTIGHLALLYFWLLRG